MEVVYFSMEETLICPVEIWPEESTRKTEMTVRRVFEENLVAPQNGPGLGNHAPVSAELVV